MITRLSRGIEALAMQGLRKPVRCVFMNRDETAEEAIARHFADRPKARDDYEVIVFTWAWEGKHGSPEQHASLAIR